MVSDTHEVKLTCVAAEEHNHVGESPAIEALIGYSPSEVVGRRLTELCLAEDAPLVVQRLREVLAGGHASNEYRILTRSGETRWVRTSTRSRREGGRITGIQGILADVTERKRAQRAR